jgi:hypothetical protein
MTEPERLNLRSHDIPADKREELLRLFPEARTEGGKSFGLRRSICGQDGVKSLARI